MLKGRQVLSDIAASVGVILTILGAGFVGNNPQSWAAGLGLGLLFANFYLSNRKLTEQFQKFKKETEAIHQTLSLATRVLDVSRSQHSVKPNYVSATKLTSDYLVNFLPGILDSLTLNRNQTLQDRSLIQDLLISLSGAITTGGAWFGITKLVSSEAWERDKSQAGFALYLDNMYKLAEQGKKKRQESVRRIFAIENNEVDDKMLSNIRYEREKSIKIRLSKNANLSDISLIYEKYPRTSEEERNPTLALEFGVNGSFDQLTKVTIFQSEEAKKHAISFLNAWETADEQEA